MASGADLLRNFGQTAHRGQLTQLGAGIAGLVNQKRAQKAEEAKVANYKGILSQFNQSHDPSLIPQLQQAYPEKFEGWQKAQGAMEESQLKNLVQRNTEITSLLDSGNEQLRSTGIEKMREIAKGYPSDSPEGKRWNQLANVAESGGYGQVQTLLDMETGQSEQGRKALGSRTSLNAEERDQGEFAIKIMESGADLQWDQATIDGAQVVANNDPKYGETISAVLNYANHLEGGMALDPVEYDKQIYGLRDEFNKATENYLKATTSYDKIGTSLADARSAEGIKDKGIADLATLTGFQRMIDEGVVRKDDVDNIKGANDLMDKLDLRISNWAEGDLLSEPQRQSMERISKEYLDAQKKYVDDYVAPPLEASFNRLNPEGDRRQEVFGKYEYTESENSFWGSSNAPTEQKEEVVTGEGVNIVEAPEAEIKISTVDLPAPTVKKETTTPAPSTGTNEVVNLW